MRKSCEVCGGGYETLRPSSSRYCGANCRKRAQRSGKAKPSPRPASVRSLPAPAAAEGGLLASTTVRLQAAGMLEDWRAQAALDIARLIETGRDGGAARASLHRELRQAMAEALRGLDAPGSALARHRDELAARREKRAR